MEDKVKAKEIHDIITCTFDMNRTLFPASYVAAKTVEALDNCGYTIEKKEDTKQNEADENTLFGRTLSPEERMLYAETLNRQYEEDNPTEASLRLKQAKETVEKHEEVEDENNPYNRNQ